MQTDMDACAAQSAELIEAISSYFPYAPLEWTDDSLLRTIVSGISQVIGKRDERIN